MANKLLVVPLLVLLVQVLVVVVVLLLQLQVKVQVQTQVEAQVEVPTQVQAQAQEQVYLPSSSTMMRCARGCSTGIWHRCYMLQLEIVNAA